MPSCAICTAEAPAGELSRQPLGRRGALVLVCRACDTEPAREVFGPELGRDIDDDADRVSALEFRRRCAAVIGDAPAFNKHGAWVNEVAPGFAIVLVERDRSRPLDSNEARETLRGKPWFSELRYLGSTNAHIIFERPSDETIARVREERERADRSSVLSAMEQFRAAPKPRKMRSTAIGRSSRVSRYGAGKTTRPTLG